MQTAAHPFPSWGSVFISLPLVINQRVSFIVTYFILDLVLSAPRESAPGSEASRKCLITSSSEDVERQHVQIVMCRLRWRAS